MSVIYHHGTILTMDENCPQVEAILVKDGMIFKRGTKKEVEAWKEKDTVFVDLQGHTMLPGFIDGHSHFSGLAASLDQCDLSKAESFQDMVELLKAFIQRNHIPKGQWVVGTNYDHNFLKEKAHPDKKVLDLVSEEHPIVAVHASSHMGTANSMGLELQGLSREIENPPGGRYGRGEGGQLNGYMEETAFVQFRNAMPIADIHKMMELFDRAQKVYAGFGITTMQEGMVTEELFPMLQYAEKNHVLKLDLVGYIDLENSRELLIKHQEYTGGYQNHLRLGGYKIFLDGSPQGRTAWMKEPYEDGKDGYCGYPVKEDEQLRQLILASMKDHQQLLSHCNGDAAAEQLITQFEQLRESYPEYEADRPVMIHAQLVQKQQLARMKKLSMIPSFFVAHTYYWGDIHIQNFGMERAENISPAGSAKKIGLPFTFHQDSPVLPPNVFQTIWCGAKRVTKSGIALSEKEQVSVYDGLKAMTIYGAWQYGEEDKKGSISEGKLADLIIVDRNPLEVPVDEVKEIQVLETVKEGRSVYSA